MGEELAVVVEEPGVVSHQFGCELRGYPGWRWSVTVAQLPGAEATLDEIVLLPTDAAILAPSWVPWRERIKAGDLSPGDLLPPDEDDPRLVPSYLAGDDTADPSSERALAKEIGLGRQRVLSLEGRNSGRRSLVRRRFGPLGAAGPIGPWPLWDLRIHGQALGPVVNHLRCLCQCLCQ
ncbi:MAG: DUF3027 domain-containing protein [Marmoricola sp.]